MDAKTLKVLSLVISAAGMVLGMAGNIVSDKKQQADIDKAVADAISKQN